MVAFSASQSWAANSTSVCSTVCRSKVERLMTLSTSAVAVCCCSDSRKSSVRACTSSNSRTFSIAITAWSAKVVDQLDLLVGEGLHLWRVEDQHADRLALAQQRDAENGAIPAEPLAIRCSGVFGIGQHVGM